jgi:hypothetical protein
MIGRTWHLRICRNKKQKVRIHTKADNTDPWTIHHLYEVTGGLFLPCSACRVRTRRNLLRFFIGGHSTSIVSALYLCSSSCLRLYSWLYAMEQPSTSLHSDRMMKWPWWQQILVVAPCYRTFRELFLACCSNYPRPERALGGGPPFLFSCYRYLHLFPNLETIDLLGFADQTLGLLRLNDLVLSTSLVPWMPDRGRISPYRASKCRPTPCRRRLH